MTEWRGVADALAMVLRKNGVGGRQFNSALDLYDEAVAEDEAQRKTWGAETCECACAHKRRDPCKFTLTGKSTDCCLPCGRGA